MTHFKSTLATAVVALTGLVVAQQVLYPRGAEPERPPLTAAMKGETVAAPAMTWIDPPAKAQASAPETTAKAAEPQAEETRVAASDPAMPVIVPTPPTRHVSLSAEAAKKADAAKRRRVAQTVARNRQVASRTVPAGESAPETAAPAEPAPRPRIDPIGDIIKGLGIGGQG